MPDIFGNPTPQEVQQQILQSQAETRAAYAQGQSGVGRGGFAIGQALGGAFRKTLDTRGARKSAAARLVEETGMSVDEARKLAKQSVPREFNQVRQAKQLEKASSVASFVFETQAPHIGVPRARAQQARVMSIQLRRLGMDTEANALTEQADAMEKAEIDRQLNVDKVKAGIESTRANTRKTESEIDEKDDTAFIDTVQTAESLRAKIETETDPKVLESLERQLGYVEANIAKQNNISLSDADAAMLNNSGENKLALEYVDQKLLEQRLLTLKDVLVEQKGSLASTAIGRFGAGAAGFMENTFGLDPGSIGADTLIGDVNEISGSSAFVSAEIRHALTGAAMSPAEAVFLQPFLSTPGESISKNIAKVDVILKFTQLDIKARQALIENPETLGQTWLESEAARSEREFNKARKDAPTTDRDVSVTEGLSRVQQLIRAAEGK